MIGRNITEFCVKQQTVITSEGYFSFPVCVPSRLFQEFGLAARNFQLFVVRVQEAQGATSRLCVRKPCDRPRAGFTSAWGGYYEPQRKQPTLGRATTHSLCDKRYRPAKWCSRYATSLGVLNVTEEFLTSFY
jgi:hypothetical protein